MNIGKAVDRIQKLGDVVDKLVKQSNEMRERVIRVEENVDETSERVAILEAKVDRQAAVIEALAREEGIDVEGVREEADVGQAPRKIAAQRLADEDDGETADDSETASEDANTSEDESASDATGDQANDDATDS